jgi:hypothetical protein
MTNRRGWYDSPTNRRGKRRIWQALTGYGRPMTTRELVQFVYPRLEKADRDQYWYPVRRAAERVAVRCVPRSRPLRWRLKPDLDRG